MSSYNLAEQLAEWFAASHRHFPRVVQWIAIAIAITVQCTTPSVQCSSYPESFQFLD